MLAATPQFNSKKSSDGVLLSTAANQQLILSPSPFHRNAYKKVLILAYPGVLVNQADSVLAFFQPDMAKDLVAWVSVFPCLSALQISLPFTVFCGLVRLSTNDWTIVLFFYIKS